MDLEQVLASLEAKLKERERIRKEMESDEFNAKFFEFAVKLEEMLHPNVIVEISADKNTLLGFVTSDGSRHFHLQREGFLYTLIAVSNVHELYNNFLRSPYLQELFANILNGFARVEIS